MNIALHLIKKYAFIPHTFDIYHENIFYYLQHFDGTHRTMYVCDENAFNIMKCYTQNSSTICLLPHKRALPTTSNARYIEERCAKYNIQQIIAFGTGAINDLCKYVAHQTNIRYIFVPTALSMNGIVSNNTSIYDDTHSVKQSIMAKSASIILLDETILTSAPKKFIGSAIMDCLAAYTACNDFLYAHQTNATEYPYNQYTFDIFHKQMSAVLNILEHNADKLYNDYKMILEVFELLYLSGCIMNYYGSSIAFSGGEHNIAHTLEAKKTHLKTEFLHGEIISAILPYYANLQLEYNGGKYIESKMVQSNLAINFAEIARKLNMQTSCKDLGVNYDEFTESVQKAKYAKERPTLLSLIF
jgi:glycerol dehydrogenase-like iron-containing ADH family enzyme